MKKLSIILCALALTACCNLSTPNASRQGTPLQQAIESGKADTVAQLLQAGASPNTATDEAEPLSPLWLALHHGRGDMDIVQQLLAAGAAVSEDEVRCAVASGFPQYLRAVLDAGGKVPRASQQKGSIYAELRKHEQDGCDNVACARLLEARGAKLQETATTPLHYAVAADDTALAAYFLSRGLRPNARNEEGETPLIYGVQSAAMVQLLVQAGADATLQDKAGNTALMNLLLPTEAAEALLKAGSKPNQCNKKGETALLYHICHPQLTGGTYTDDNGDIIATWSGDKINADMVQLLIRAGADVNSPNTVGTTPLQAAAGNEDIVEMLRAAGAKR